MKRANTTSIDVMLVLLAATFILLLWHATEVARAQFPNLLLINSSVPTANNLGGSIDENFEATGAGVAGYDLSGWTEAGNAGSITNANYTSAPAPIEGAQSLQLANTGFDQVFTFLDMFPFSATGTNEMSGYFEMVYETQHAGTTFFAVAATNSDFEFRMQVDSGGGIKLYLGSDAVVPGYGVASVATLPTAVTNRIWWNFAKGDSSINSTGQVWFTNSATAVARPPDGCDANIKIVNGTNGFNVEQIFLILQNFSAALDKATYDKIRVRNGPISAIDAIIP